MTIHGAEEITIRISYCGATGTLIAAWNDLQGRPLMTRSTSLSGLELKIR